MAVNIVTGMTGIEHITSHDDRARNASQFGRGKYVFDVGNKFSASIIDDNLVRIQDGMCINQGTQMGIEPNDYADVEIDNGLLGTNRHDIIVMRYEKNEETLLEKASLAVVKGVNSSEPVDPDITEGNILDGGDLVDDMPLYRVVIEGVNLVSIEPLFEVFDGDVGSILEELEDKVDKVTGKGLSTNDYTDEDKTKLDGIETGAEVNVQADWSQNDNTADDFIKHKPSIPSKTSDLQNDSNFVSDADYAHTDNNYTNADKEDVAKIDSLDTRQTQSESDIEDLEHSLSTTSTTTGNPISISDSAHVNAEELTVELEPIQDLHGYDNPWVGGAGKNLLPYPYVETTKTVNGVTFTDVGDGIIKTNGTATARSVFYLRNPSENWRINEGSYIVSKSYLNRYMTLIVDGYLGSSWVKNLARSASNDDATFTVDYDGYDRVSTYIEISSGINTDNITFKPMIRLATETDPTFEPYSNICPISGYDETSVVIKDTAENPTVTDTYTLQFGDTVYGAAVDFVSGVATVTKGYIAEYAGETLPSTWISDRDVYASGTTPTTGAEVVYELATPYTIQLTPQQIKMLKGNNVLVADGDMDLVYQTDSVVGDIKEWTENEFLPKSSETAQHNYSTQEQVVGTWIDGKPLYQKTFEKDITVSSFSRTWYTAISTSELALLNANKIMIDSDHSFIEDSDGIYPVNYSSVVETAGGVIGGVYDKASNSIRLCIAGLEIATLPAVITIQYTKTTV